MFDRLLYLGFLALIQLLRALPYALATLLVGVITRAIFFVLPRYRRICFKNLQLAFPNNVNRQTAIYRSSFLELGRLVVDLCRLDRYDLEWCRSHIDASEFDEVMRQYRSAHQAGVLLVSGHLGSFELLGHCFSAFSRPIAVVMRRLSSPRINAWWIRRRSLAGNSVLDREGGLRAIIRTLRAGTDVGVLYDQNVTRANAVFVSWFGRKAATTAAVAAAALSTGAPIAVCTILNLPNRRYKVRCEAISIADIVNDVGSDRAVKILRITERVTEAFEKRVVEFPEGWFWMHRRWRTTEMPSEVNFYAEL